MYIRYKPLIWSVLYIAVVLIVTAFLLSSCATTAFDKPTEYSAQKEREDCYSSGVCRALISEKPPALLASRNRETNCAAHAVRAAHILHDKYSIHYDRMRVMVGTTYDDPEGVNHAVLFVTWPGGREWAIDQGGLGRWPSGELVCPEGVCLAAEAERAMGNHWFWNIIEAEQVDRKQRNDY